MALINVGLDNVELSGKSELLTTGFYPALECTSSKLKIDPNDPSKPGRIDCIFIDANSEEGAIVFVKFFLGEKSKWVLKQFLAYSGSQLEDDEELDTDNLIGLTCAGEIGTNSYIAKKDSGTVKKGDAVESTQIDKWLETVED